ncbi:MAG: hypothetical protein LBL34_01155 [Clostridiales bacterium]|jgi:hypothetical protein|nr:hypothetical protein [Clostridiales bacterium]
MSILEEKIRAKTFLKKMSEGEISPDFLREATAFAAFSKFVTNEHRNLVLALSFNRDITDDLSMIAAQMPKFDKKHQPDISIQKIAAEGIYDEDRLLSLYCGDGPLRGAPEVLDKIPKNSEKLLNRIAFSASTVPAPAFSKITDSEALVPIILDPTNAVNAANAKKTLIESLHTNAEKVYDELEKHVEYWEKQLRHGAKLISDESYYEKKMNDVLELAKDVIDNIGNDVKLKKIILNKEIPIMMRVRAAEKTQKSSVLRDLRKSRLPQEIKSIIDRTSSSKGTVNKPLTN